MEKFLKETISICDFCWQLPEKRSLNSDAANKLKSNLILLSPHEKSNDFSNLLEAIDSKCEQFDIEEENAEDDFSGNSSLLKIIASGQYLSKSCTSWLINRSNPSDFGFGSKRIKSTSKMVSGL